MTVTASVTIRWKLREIMARERVSATHLASLMGVHRVTLTNWKNSDKVPPLDGDRLNDLCRFLGCVPGDFFEYIPDEEAAHASR